MWHRRRKQHDDKPSRKKLDAIDTDQITPAADCVSESLETLDERWKAGSFRYLMPDFRARVHSGPIGIGRLRQAAHQPFGEPRCIFEANAAVADPAVFVGEQLLVRRIVEEDVERVVKAVASVLKMDQSR